ncbi:hypothetical protein M3Y96_00193800 [Aphelenchoides besseyi]|nr:hypothetical protein M3Y96_00193800 [Aphelenchoides besseyi]
MSSPTNSVFGYTVYTSRQQPRTYAANPTLNPQGWASHNKYDLDNRRPLNNAEESTEGLAVLPTLLMENPRARSTFENLSFYANPQYKRDYRPARTVDVHISEAAN